jgi:hypothetical protein
MVGTFRLLACICISLLALSACGGGSSSSSSTPNPPPPVIPAGSFLAAPGANCSAGTPCTGPESSLSFTTAAFTASDVGSGGGAMVTLATDATTGRATFVTLNVPTPSGPNYVHAFNLATAQAGTGAFTGFAAVVDGQTFSSDGSRANNFIFDPTLTYSSYGVWGNITAVDASQNETGASGVVAFGQLTPSNATIPKVAPLTYTGRTLGIVIGDPSLAPANGPLALVGTASLTADFNLMTVNGSFNLKSVNTNGVVNNWSTLTLPSTSITTATGFPYTGPISGTAPGATAVAGTLFGNFYGPVANETAGTWSVSGGPIHAAGAYGAKR